MYRPNILLLVSENIIVIIYDKGHFIEVCRKKPARQLILYLRISTSFVALPAIFVVLVSKAARILFRKPSENSTLPYFRSLNFLLSRQLVSSVTTLFCKINLQGECIYKMVYPRFQCFVVINTPPQHKTKTMSILKLLINVNQMSNQIKCQYQMFFLTLLGENILFIYQASDNIK